MVEQTKSKRTPDRTIFDFFLPSRFARSMELEREQDSSRAVKKLNSSSAVTKVASSELSVKLTSASDAGMYLPDQRFRQHRTRTHPVSLADGLSHG